MKRSPLIVIALLLLTLTVSAGQAIISGRVTNKSDGLPLAGVLVTVRPAGENRIVKFAQTSAEGRYEISFSALPENHVIHFSMMGFAPQTIALTNDREHYNAELSEQATELKEVIVNAPGIHQKGDTITYVVSSFADTQDKTLSDVLKKMPGIEVEKSGAIKYNGVSINKFYIEGRDMLEGRYSLATENMHQKDVGSVEVMENHQPIKALEDISFSNNPAINIRLKEDAKARWVGTVNAGTGFEPLLWNAELFAMRFTPKAQTLNTYKTNNTGVDIVREIRQFSVDDLLSQFSKNYSLSNYINVRPNYLTDIDAHRARFNKSHLFSTNNLWAIADNIDLTSQVSYTNNRLNSDNFSKTTYFLIDSTIVTDIGQSSLSKQNRLSADITITNNKPSYYLKNKLNTDIYWDDVTMDITGSFPNRQEGSVPERRVSNDLEILSRSGTRTFTINSFNLYQVKPQHLVITRDDETQQQQVHSSAFYTNTNTSLGFYINPVSISMKMGIIGVIRDMESELTGVSDTLGRLSNDISMQYLNLYLSPQAEFKKDGFEARFDMPVSFTPYRYNNKLSDTKETVSKFLVSPRLSMRYFITTRLSASLSGSLTQSPVDEQQFYDGLILTNYRNLSLGYIDYSTATQKSVSAGISYRNAIKTLFGNVSAVRSWNKSVRASNRSFINEFILNSYVPRSSQSGMWMLNGSVSKGLDFIRGMITVRSSYMGYEGSIYQNEYETPYSSDMWSISPKVNSTLTSWFNASYELSFSKNRISVSGSEITSSSEQIWQTVLCNFTPVSNLSIKLIGEHYYNNMSDGVNKSIFLSDAEFTYSFTGGWEVNLAVNNIFNRDAYSYTIYNGLTSIDREYRIRPINVLASLFFRF